MNKITKQDQKKMERFFKKYVQNKFVLALLVFLLPFGVNYYNNTYLKSKNQAVVMTQTGKQTVRCVDGDTFAYGDEKVRMLALDTPESVKPNHPVEPYGKEASEYTCNLLKNANNLELKQDIGNERDKYGRILAWVYLDGELLQEKIIREGLGEIKYVNKKTVDYKILGQLEKAQEEAQGKKLNIWKE